jgi:hypothetical protein
MVLRIPSASQRVFASALFERRALERASISKRASPCQRGGNAFILVRGSGISGDAMWREGETLPPTIVVHREPSLDPALGEYQRRCGE